MSQEVCTLTVTHTHTHPCTDTLAEDTHSHAEGGTHTLSLLEGSESLLPSGAYTSLEKEGKGGEEREIETRMERAREEEEGGEEGRDRRKRRVVKLYSWQGF